jgi:hypothetical protein
MKMYGEVFLASALVGDGWSDSRHGLFTLRKSAPGTHWIGGWVDPRTGLDGVDSNSDLSVVQPVASRYTDYAIQAPYRFIRKF